MTTKKPNNLALVLDVEQIPFMICPSSHDLRATNLKTNKFYITPGAVAIVAEDPKSPARCWKKG